MAGLIHDIGKMIIDTYFPDEIGMQHTEVGGWMGERWQLPQHLINAIAYHHSTAPEHLAQPIIACVQAADACAKLALTSQDFVIAPEVLQALKLTDKQFLDVVEELRNRKSEIDKFLV
jgi:HD-like signal output (HDOD) protein